MRYLRQCWHCSLSSRSLVAVLCCFLYVALAQIGRAASTILSTGFESPYTPGQLQGQFGWVTAGSGASTAVVQNSIANSGAQAVTVTKAAAANSDRRWAVPESGYPTQRYVIVDWDMRVAQSTITTGFGPFFGFDTYDASTAPYVLASLGVDATTGDVLYQFQDTGVLTESGSKANFNQWYHYRLVMDFSTDTYTAYFNGAQVANTGFVDRAFNLNHFTDADIATFAASDDPVSQSVSSSAVFDNVIIRDGLLGDYDIDGDVDSSDYTRWRQSYGTAISPAGNNADGNHNGVVDAADYVLWRRAQGTSIASGAAYLTGAVPEPTSIMGIATLAFALAFSRGQRQRFTR